MSRGISVTHLAAARLYRFTNPVRQVLVTRSCPVPRWLSPHEFSRKCVRHSPQGGQEKESGLFDRRALSHDEHYRQGGL